ncbi:hypothetical protein BDV96DRAFT_579867 [Lophiotrema nucula]|uniref:Zn(2)-C6 fungal-type domain-containing protein n=1 Tax=Lophiotrema nucula TaxID=690887 RepID=A0A6A5YZG5_9PLEO|nr:hypothetical protein BDV96DRAFT_579867 [Lophiotrema nucula]
MASASSSTLNDIDLDALIQSLPACKRCRECRRGCDTLLPKCRQCTKAGVSCVYWDHGRKDYIERSYIAGLVDYVRRLHGENLPSPAMETPQSMSTVSSATAQADSDTYSHPHHEHHFASAGDSYRYLGAESCLVKSPRLQPAMVSTDNVDDEDWRVVYSEPPISNHELVRYYLAIIQPLYPILDPSLRFLAPDLPPDLSHAELFCLYMIYSIACHFYPGTSPCYTPDGKLSFHHAKFYRYRIMGEGYFKEAMKYLEASTVEPTIPTLRAVLLLAINSLFEPKSGNIGQQVALATRLALSLEKQDLGPEDAAMIHNMHLTIFSIENEIASTLDRPATFPEPDCEMSFSESKPAEYLCSLYRLQHRFRKGDTATKKLLPCFDDRTTLDRLPGLRLALHQTHLLLNPCWGSAWHVLEAVVAKGSVHVFLTPHWVFRAGTVLLNSMDSILEGNILQLYSNALVVLNLSSGKWPSAATLAASLGDLMTQMKMKYRPTWENTLRKGDVTI